MLEEVHRGDPQSMGEAVDNLGKLVEAQAQLEAKDEQMATLPPAPQHQQGEQPSQLLALLACLCQNPLSSPWSKSFRSRVQETLTQKFASASTTLA